MFPLHIGLKAYSVFRRDRLMGTDPRGGVVLALHINLNPILVTSASNSEFFSASFLLFHAS